MKHEIWTEIEAIEGLERLIVKKLWERMRKDAVRGALRFGEHDDVSVITRVPDLLELRLQVHPSHKDERKRFLLRLYFAEPPSHEGLMLGLKFGRKPANGDPEREQDDHIDQARDRYDVGKSLTPPWGMQP